MRGNTRDYALGGETISMGKHQSSAPVSSLQKPRKNICAFCKQEVTKDNYRAHDDRCYGTTMMDGGPRYLPQRGILKGSPARH